MSNSRNGLRGIVALACIALLAAAPVFAEKPDSAGGGKEKKGGKGPDKEMRADHGKGGKGGKDRHGGGDGPSAGGVSVDVHFTDAQRTSVRTYYGEQVRAGHCPPGLAKKNNGCMPPGQAKKWAIGQPLPPDVVYVDLEPEIIVRIGLPPPDHKFVRVAGDILLIATGTAMVLDAIEDLGSL